MNEADKKLERVRKLISTQFDSALAVAFQDLDDHLRGVGVGLPAAWSQAAGGFQEEARRVQRVFDEHRDD